MKKYTISFFLHNLIKSGVLIVMIPVLFLSCATTGSGSGMSIQDAIEQSAEKIATIVPKGSIVAVAAFETENDHLSNYLINELNGALSDRGIKMVNRNSLKYVERELRFQMSGAVSDATVQSIGNFFGAEIIIVGELTDIGRTYRYRAGVIHIEEATGSSIRLDIKNDSTTRRMIATIAKQKTVTTEELTYQTVPSSALDFLERGIVLAMRQDYNPAIENFSDAIKLNSDLIGAYILRGRALSASISTVYAINAGFRPGTIIDKDRKISTEEQKIYNLAIEDFTKVTKLSPIFATAYHERGYVFLEIYDYDQSITEFNQTIRLDPNHSSAYNNRGLAFYNRNTDGDLDRAIADYSQAIKLDQNDAMTYRNRGSAYYDRNNSGDLDLAIADFTEAIKLNPDDMWHSWVYNERGNAYYARNNRGDYNRAIVDYTQAIKLDPDYTWAYINRGQIYYKRNNRGDYNRAIENFTEAIRIDQSIALAFNERGLAYHNRNNSGDLDRAITDFTQAITLNPNNAVHYNNRGWAYNDRKNSGDNAQSIADFSDSIKLDPNYSYAYNGRGWAYFDRKDYDLAIADFTEAIRLDQNYALAYNGRGVAYSWRKNKGDMDLAIADYEAALRIDPNNANAGQWKKNLRLARGR